MIGVVRCGRCSLTQDLGDQGPRTYHDMRNTLYQKIRAVFLLLRPGADHASHLRHQRRGSVQMFVGQGFIALLAVFMIVGSLILLVALDWQPALIMLVLMPLTMLVSSTATRARPPFRK
jgi:ABC-type multidrug transport system fused ATPase/permease subunit